MAKMGYGAGVHGGYWGPKGGGTFQVGRYKVKGANRKIIGVQSGASLIVTDDASAGGETSGWTKNIDIASYSYGAVISLDNATSGTRTLYNVQVRGKPVELLQGAEGIIHDSYIDPDSVYENGERKIEWGNDFVVEKTQVEDIANYLWKEHRSKKHIYFLTLPGTRYYYEPDDWYWLTIGGSGQIEYIDSLVRVFQVETYRRAGELGTTQIMLKEVEEAWKNDSSAYARYIASGRTYQLPAQIGGIRIGSQYSTDKCDIYCDGTSDQTEINQAITTLADSYGGGIVHLSRGIFLPDGPITLKAGVILEGEGNATVIEKNCNDYGIECDGASGSEIANAGIRSLKVTRNAADTNDVPLVFLDFADDFLVEDILLEDAYATAMIMSDCDRVNINNLHVFEFGTGGVDPAGLRIRTGGEGQISNVFIDGNSQARTVTQYGIDMAIANYDFNNIRVQNLTGDTDIYGIHINDNETRMSAVTIKNLTRTTEGWVYGLYVDGNDCTIGWVHVSNIDNSHTANNSKGVIIDSGQDDNTIWCNVMGCSGIGVEVNHATCDRNVLVGRSQGNGTNLTDNGTNTNKNAFDST